MVCCSCIVVCVVLFFFFKQKTAYEMRISDWSSDVCSSDLPTQHLLGFAANRLNDFLAAGAAIVTDGNNRRLVKNDTFAANVNQGIGGSKIDRHIAGKITTKESEHGRTVI